MNVDRQNVTDLISLRLLALGEEWGPDNLYLRMPSFLRTVCKGWIGDGPIHVCWDQEQPIAIVEVIVDGQQIIRIAEPFDLG